MISSREERRRRLTSKNVTVILKMLIKTPLKSKAASRVKTHTPSELKTTKTQCVCFSSLSLSLSLSLSYTPRFCSLCHLLWTSFGSILLTLSLAFHDLSLFLTKPPHSHIWVSFSLSLCEKMGCAQSRIDNEESVARCKERKNLMKEAVVARNAFAAGHSGYAMALKNTGAALSDFGHGEAEDPLHQNENDNEHHNQPLEPASKPPPPPPPPSIDESLLPPPPPLPNFSSSPSPIKRSTSLPANVNVKGQRRLWTGGDTISIAEEEEEEEEVEEEEEEENHDHHHGDDRDGGNVNNRDVKSNGNNSFAQKEVVPGTPTTLESKGAWDYFFMMNMPGSTLTEEDVGNIQNVDVGVAQFRENVNVGPDMVVEIEPKTPEKVEEEKVYVENKEEKQIEHAKTAPPEFRRVAAQGSSVRLKTILKELDDCFLEASNSAQEVSKMLEATRLHYHSNFADNRGNPFFLLLFLYATFVVG